jgi:hypothetical protein
MVVVVEHIFRVIIGQEAELQTLSQRAAVIASERRGVT